MLEITKVGSQVSRIANSACGLDAAPGSNVLKTPSRHWVPLSPFLPHRAEVFGRYSDEHALLTGTSERILIFVKILLRHLVDVFVGPVLGNVGHTATNLKIAVWIVG